MDHTLLYEYHIQLRLKKIIFLAFQPLALDLANAQELRFLRRGGVNHNKL